MSRALTIRIESWLDRYYLEPRAKPVVELLQWRHEAYDFMAVLRGYPDCAYASDYFYLTQQVFFESQELINKPTRS